MLPLEDVTVVTVEQAVAGPLATRHLADLGARVIKIERPGTGDFARHYDDAVHGLSSHFVWLNRSKESISVDLKHEEGKRILEKLVARSDIFLENLGPDAIERLGFSAKHLRTQHPRLITCEISGYGSSGPFRHRKAYDLLIQAESGLLSITGTEASPSRVGISVADIAAGIYAYSGILAALLKRQKTDEGSHVEVSLLEALGEWMGYPVYYAGYGGMELRRAGTHHATIAPYGDVPTDDGLVFIGIQNDAEWRRFCDKVLGQPELGGDTRFATNRSRVEHRERLLEIIGGVFSPMTTAEAMERLAEAGIAHAQVNSVLDFIAHPQLAARNRWREIDSPVGKLSALLPPAEIEGVEPRMGRVPDLGEHNRAILSALGYDEATIRRLREEGVI
ncbi:MAG TPA: CaiB/BaiF CoA-transferase family protein [Vicinamibacteria bacterium]|nr:CaiB/BaiF CoA-transferase family protein [Vicinamibacteria bacterium]